MRRYKNFTAVLLGTAVIILPFIKLSWWHLPLPIITLLGIAMLTIAIRNQRCLYRTERSQHSKAVLIALYVLSLLLLIVAAFGIYAAYIVGPPVPN